MIGLLFNLVWLPIRLALAVCNLLVSLVFGLLFFFVGHIFLTLILIGAAILLLQ